MSDADGGGGGDFAPGEEGDEVGGTAGGVVGREPGYGCETANDFLRGVARAQLGKVQAPVSLGESHALCVAQEGEVCECGSGVAEQTV